MCRVTTHTICTRIDVHVHSPAHGYVYVKCVTYVSPGVFWFCSLWHCVLCKANISSRL